MSSMTFEEYQLKRSILQGSLASPEKKEIAINELDAKFNVTESAAIAYEDFHASAADLDDVGN